MTHRRDRGDGGTSPFRQWMAALATVGAVACGPGGGVQEPFPAQSIWASPARPPLAQDADTNDPAAYYALGVETITFRPDTAAAAFYWTTQLDPWRADAYYARAVALMRSLWAPRRSTRGMWVPKRRLHLREIAVIDSLNHVAYDLDPYIDRRFDNIVGPPASRFLCNRVRDPTTAGACFIQSGDFALALERLGEAMKKDSTQIQLHYMRAHAHFRLGHFDSAATELGVLADSLGRRQEKKLTAFYISRATIYYAQGMAYTQMDDTAAARTAYERALVEDLGFHMASVRLAGRALTSGDTTAALNHLAHAVAVSPFDAPLRLYYGIILAARGQHAEAQEQFHEAIEIRPHFAQPYLHVGQQLERVNPARALASYESFLLRAARNDPSRTWVEQRLRRLLGDTLAVKRDQ